MSKLNLKLENNNIYARKISSKDAYILKIAIDNSITNLAKWLVWANPTPNLKQCEDFCLISENNFLENKEFVFLLFDKNDDELVGCCTIMTRNWGLKIFELGYWGNIIKSKKGLMSDGVNIIIDYAFNYLEARRLFATADLKNLDSIRLLENLNFNFEGIMHRDRIGVDGQNLRDTILYAKWC